VSATALSDVPTTAPPPRARDTWSERHYWPAVAVIGVAALAVRVGYVLGVTRYENNNFYDAFIYEMQGLGLASGNFFPVPFGHGPTASHPPLTALSIAPSIFLFGFHPSVTPARMTMVVLGTATVVAVAILGRSVAGARIGLLAGVLAVGYPEMWIPNGIVMSETPTMLVMVLILLAVYRLLRRPTFASAALVGLACGAMVLVRAELALFVPTLLVPAALLASGPSLRRRLALAGVGTLVAVLVVMPWVGRNLASFQDTTFVSTGSGLVLLGANCPAAYYGPGIGGWSISCVALPSVGDESVDSARDGRIAKSYIEHHLSRLPVVMAARVGRLWDVYDPIVSAEDTNEGRPLNASLAGLAVYYLLVPAAVVGVVSLRRRRLTQWPLLVPAGVLTVVAALAYGLVRFRAPFEVCLVVLAAAGVDALVRAAGRRRGRHSRPRDRSVAVGSPTRPAGTSLASAPSANPDPARIVRADAVG
jgi:hypothetical protein